MLLLDTSIWIDLLRGNDNQSVRYVLQREAHEDLVFAPVTYLEVLQGARTATDAERIRAFLAGFDAAEPAIGLATYEDAARLYQTARTRGITIRTAIDCLIAAIAMEHDAVLVHNDRDFLALATVEPRLQIYPLGAIKPAH